MRLISGWIILFLIMMFSGPGFAQMYQYTDPNGNIRFTDNLANVPEAHRDAVETMETIPSSVEEEIPAAPEMSLKDAPRLPEATAPDSLSDPMAEDALDDQFRAAKESLELERAEIQELYAQIEADKQSFGEPLPESASRMDRRVHHQETLNLNRRIEDYQARVEAYRERLEAFNAGDPQKAMR